MVAGNDPSALEVGDSTSDATHPVPSPTGEPKPVYRSPEEPLGVGIPRQTVEVVTRQ